MTDPTPTTPTEHVHPADHRTVDWLRVREQMRAAHVTQHALAEKARVVRPDVTAILNNRSYVGKERAERMLRALHEMGVDVDGHAASNGNE